MADFGMQHRAIALMAITTERDLFSVRSSLGLCLGLCVR
jgi:hypothetical protein